MIDDNNRNNGKASLVLMMMMLIRSARPRFKIVTDKIFTSFHEREREQQKSMRGIERKLARS